MAPTMPHSIRILSFFTGMEESFSRMIRTYCSDDMLRTRLDAAVELMVNGHQCKGKTVMTGIGKSGYVARKVSATLNSLGIESVFLHPVEALHGDIGSVKNGDIMIMITNSGKTQELKELATRIADSIPIIIISSIREPDLVEVQGLRSIVLPIVNTNEDDICGVKTPTISTLLALALGDALAVSVARQIHGKTLRAVFEENHPGGAIGALNTRRSLPRGLKANI